MPDLDAYFARIGFQGPRDPSLATLRAIHLHHACAIPFENLDVLLGRPIRLEPDAIERKLVHERRGGYCFEQNRLLADVLRALGFEVTTHLARVRWQIPAEVVTALTHMILRVVVDGRPWLADVGFGGIGLTAPLALDTAGEQTTPHEPRRIVNEGSTRLQQVRLGEEWADVCRFTLEPAHEIDFQLSNWYTSAHPESRFMKNLIVARPGSTHRYAVINREFVVRDLTGHAERRILDTPEELLTVLAESFDLHFPVGTRFGIVGSPWPV